MSLIAFGPFIVFCFAKRGHKKRLRVRLRGAYTYQRIFNLKWSGGADTYMTTSIIM